MPQELIIIFLLFIAVLAFGWFYLQRAKARTDTTVTTTAPTETTAPTQPTPPSEPAAAATPASHSDEPPTA